MDDPLLDPRLLRLLDALHRTKSVTQAAELLGQSQPTVSIGLARLRRRTGDPLFVRTPEGMPPTPRAEGLIGPAREALGFVPWFDAGFYQQALYPQDWICVVNARHPRLARTLTRRAWEGEGQVGIIGGTGAELLAAAIKKAKARRQVVLELPGFLGLGAIVASTDLVATLPRHIGETLAASHRLAVRACPIAIPSFVAKQHWDARAHHDSANRWLRTVCESLFQRHRGRTDAARAG